MLTSKQYRYKLEQLKGQKYQIISDIKTEKEEKIKNKKLLHQYEQAREIVKIIGQKMQENLQFHIGNITSLALESIFPEPYKLELEFLQRRNKTECDIWFTRNGIKINPLDASGGGIVDVASFALRIASWSLQNPKKRNVIILDEPMRFVSENYRNKTSEIIKEISEKLNIQFIIITHDPNFTEFADKIFKVKKNKRFSEIEIL